ncbi:SCO family protein [Cupriavidus sp. 2MCAB6]|uniref:SCO family protein n=1 Tax=Cupriavidus sp. 2MCAB6 TaxID=3232981 RepID=UPI003F9285D1
MATDSRTSRRPPSLWAAGLGCLALCLGFAAALAWLTWGMRVWTLDDRRSAMAMAGKLVAPPLAMRDARGDRFTPWTPASRSGQVYLVDFIYTRCATVCAALGPAFFRLQQDIQAQGLADRVGLLSISIDPAHDETRRLAAYGAQQRADPGIWRIGAPVAPAAQAALLRSLDVVVIPDGLGGYIHNAEIHLIDGRGVVLGLYDYQSFDQALVAARQAAR